MARKQLEAAKKEPILGILEVKGKGHKINAGRVTLDDTQQLQPGWKQEELGLASADAYGWEWQKWSFGENGGEGGGKDKWKNGGWPTEFEQRTLEWSLSDVGSSAFHFS